MRLPRFRLRDLMVAVAVTALVLGLMVRRGRLLRLAAYHASQSILTMTYQVDGAPAGVDGALLPGAMDFSTPRSQWHARMYVKYDQAASRPWLPFALDPPEPK